MNSRMKSVALAAVMSASVLVSATDNAFAWGRLGHASVARIAENHLTETTRKALKEYLHGASIVEYASYADDYKNVMLIDKGFDPVNTKRIDAYPHTFEATVDGKVFRGINDNGRYVKNCVHYCEIFAERLKDAKNMDDSTRFNNIVLLVHFVGDMHCPEHMRFNPEDMTIGYYNVIFKGEPLRYHTFWDDQCLSNKYPWSFSDIAYEFDTLDPDQIREVCKGGLYDWASDAALKSWPVHQIKEGDKLTGKFILENMDLAKTEIRNAGYRLAEILNRTFDPKYARKVAKQNK